MVLRSKIIGKNNKSAVESINRDDGLGLLTYNSDIRKGDFSIKPLVNPSFGAALNQNAQFSGTPENVHDGTDNIYWTGSNISGGRVTFNSTEQAKTGTQSVKVNDARAGNTWQFAKGSNLDLSGYVALSLSVYVDQIWANNNTIIIYGYDTVGGVQVGGSIELKDYVAEDQSGFWQDVVIPLSDIGLTGETIDALRFECTARSGAGAVFFIDDMAFQQSGGTIIYEATPTTGKKFYVTGLIFNIASSGTSATTPPALAYDRLGNLPSLDVGCIIRAISGGSTLFQFLFRQLSDLFNGNSKLVNVVESTATGAESTHYSVSYDFTKEEYIVLDSKEIDSVQILINDNLSSLLLFNCFIRGFEENI